VCVTVFITSKYYFSTGYEVICVCIIFTAGSLRSACSAGSFPKFKVRHSYFSSDFGRSASKTLLCIDKSIDNIHIYKKIFSYVFRG